MPDQAAHDQLSAAHVIAEKIERDGPIALGDYIAIANQYYYAGKDPLGEQGDFITAPEISQMFGEIVGIWLADLWQRKPASSPCHYVELGPGRGTLASDALRTMARFGYQPSVNFVENSPLLKAKQASRHPDARWHDDFSSLPEDGPLLVIANEFFDALPVEQYIATASGWRRTLVARDRSRFITLADPDDSGDRLSTIGRFPEGTILERSPVSGEIFAAICNRIARQGGLLLLIDYGYNRPGIGSTLQAVKNHLPVSPFDSPGTADLTAHVDFLTLANIARTQLLPVHGPVEQGQWLTSLGINARAKSLAAAQPEAAADIAAALHRLTHVDEMGRLFKVMAVTALDWPEPEGFTYADEDV